MDGARRVWTIPTFVVDRQGIIRFVHPGGACPPGSRDFRLLSQAIEEQLDGLEPVSGGER